MLENIIVTQQKVSDLNKQIEHFLQALQEHIVSSALTPLGDLLKPLITLMETIKTEMHQLVLQFGDPVNQSIQIAENHQYYNAALKAALGDYIS